MFSSILVRSATVLAVAVCGVSAPAHAGTESPPPGIGDLLTTVVPSPSPTPVAPPVPSAPPTLAVPTVPSPSPTVVVPLVPSPSPTLSASPAPSPSAKAGTTGGSQAAASTALTYRTSIVGKTVVLTDVLGWLATFTKGSRTVTLRGLPRTLSEPNVAATVRTNVYVRLLKSPFTGTVDPLWLVAALLSTGQDVLGAAMQYVAGAPARMRSGLRVAGDASYGPLQSDGTRQEGSDFNDYLGIAWKYGTTNDAPEPAQYGSLDCSGFTRMVFGYRKGFGLSLGPDGRNLPRRAVSMAGPDGPGRVIQANTGTQAPVTAAIRPGDLVFFDASSDDGTAIDHVGIYLGKDTAGRARFISSRKSANGPTIGDVGGASVIDGTGTYARAFRSVRRI